MKDDMILNEKQFDAFLNDLTEKMQLMIADGAASALRDLDLARPAATRALGALGDDEKESSVETSFRFFKAVLGGDRMAAKALSESSATAGGYLVPEGFRAEVIKRLPEAAELAPYVRSVPVVTDTGNLPSLATDISVAWNAGADGENANFTESDPVLGSINWSLKRADAITKLSRELVNDGTPAVVEFVTGLFREAIAMERDRVIALGNGSSEPYGIYSTSGIDEVDVGGSLTFSKLVEIEQTLKKKYRTGARWLMNGTNLRRVYSLLDSQNRPIFMRDMVGGIPESRILGYPVSQQDDLTDDIIFFGDLSYYLWFDRGEMGIESSNEAGEAFQKHQTWIKVWERVDGKVALTEAFAKGSGITG